MRHMLAALKSLSFNVLRLKHDNFKMKTSHVRNIEMSEEVHLEHLGLLHPIIRPYVKVLITHEFGLLRELPKIHSISSGSIFRKNEEFYGDRFQLTVPYCRKLLNWHVLMNCNDVTKAPDFIMEENLLANTTLESIKTKVPSWANWRPTDVRCLLNVVLELLDLYKSFQIQLLKVNPNLQRYLFEYDTLLSMADVSEKNIEISVQVRNPIVVFLIHLTVDFSKLPTALPDTEDLLVLVVDFKDNAKNTVQLLPRTELSDCFGESLELPDLSPDISLMDYVPEVEHLLQQKVGEMINALNQRKLLYSYLVQFLEPSLISGDNVSFKDVAFLLENEGFYCILKVVIPSDYPHEFPVCHLLPFAKSKSSTKIDCPFNQNMEHEEIARCIFTYVRDEGISKIRK